MEEAEDLNNIYMGLMSNAYAGPLIDETYRSNEKPLAMYMKMIRYYKGNFLTRIFFKLLLWLTGNRRIIKSLKYI